MPENGKVVMTVGNQKMQQLRLSLGLTQKQVAEAVGISQSSYAMIERGYRHPRKEVEKKLADFFRVTVDELFFSPESYVPEPEDEDLPENSTTE